jgi:hypothetical protein
MNRLIKYIFLILTIMVNNDSYSQEQNVLKTIRIELKNSTGENIENAKILIDSVEIKYDILTKGYFGSGQFSNDFTIEVTCKGYEKLTYKRTDLPYSQGSTDFIARLYLIGQGDKYYYRYSKLKVPYSTRSSELLVTLKKDINRSTKEIIDSFEKIILKHDLIIYKNFLDGFIPSDSTNKPIWDEPLSGIELQVVIKRKDGSNFEYDFCNELAFLRQLDEVDFAGPLIITGNNYQSALTYDNTVTIKLSNTSITNSNIDIEKAKINSIIKQIHINSFFDEDNLKIVLPLSSNEIVTQVIDQLNTSIIYYQFYSTIKTNLLKKK